MSDKELAKYAEEYVTRQTINAMWSVMCRWRDAALFNRWSVFIAEDNADREEHRLSQLEECMKRNAVNMLRLHNLHVHVKHRVWEWCDQKEATLGAYREKYLVKYVVAYMNFNSANIMRSALYQWRGRTVAHLKGDGTIKERVISCNSPMAENITPEALREEQWKTFLYNTGLKISEYLMPSMTAHKLRIWNRHLGDDNRRLMMGGRLEESEEEDHIPIVFISRRTADYRNRHDDHTYIYTFQQQMEDEAISEALAHISLQEADPERVRFRLYQHGTRYCSTAQLDHRIEFENYRFDPTDGRDTVCIEAAFGNTGHKFTMYAIMELGSACIIDRTFHPDESNMGVIEDRESTAGIGKMVAALQRGNEIVTTELQRGKAGKATLVVTRMFPIGDLHGQDEEEQRETVQRSDPMRQELNPTVRFNMYERPAIVSKKSQGSDAETNEAYAKESGTRTKCKRCQGKIMGGGFYSDDNGSYGYCDLCITEQASTTGFRLARSCTRCKGLCGAPAIQHMEGCRSRAYGDTSIGGQYHCAPCCISSGCTCPQRPESFDITRYRADRRLPASIRGDTSIGRTNRIESGYGGHEELKNWEDLHKVYVNRSPYGSDGYQDALAIMEGITITILAQLDASSEAWREVRDSTRSHTIMEVVFHIPSTQVE